MWGRRGDEEAADARERHTQGNEHVAGIFLRSSTNLHSDLRGLKGGGRAMAAPWGPRYAAEPSCNGDASGGSDGGGPAVSRCGDRGGRRGVRAPPRRGA